MNSPATPAADNPGINPAGRRLAVVLSHPTQYYSPWFRWLAAHSGLTIRVFYLWDFGIKAQRDPGFGQTYKWDVDLLSGYDSEFVPNVSRHPGTETFGGLNNPTLTGRVAAWKPDAALVFGYRYRTHLGFILWARRHRLPLIFRGDSHLIDQPRPGRLKRLILGWLYRRFAAITYVGLANRDYFAALGIPSSRLYFAPHAVDATLFDPTSPSHQAAAAALRLQLGLSSHQRVVLYAGKFHPEKQPRALLDAFLAVAPAEAVLIFVGDGAERESLQAAARRAPEGRIYFLPFANQSQMPARYLLADLFVLPSRGYYETWGLAVNEAMHMGVPCLVSRRVGCQRDLVTHGETGWVFDSEMPGEFEAHLAEALRALGRDRYLLQQRVLQRVADYSYKNATAGLLAALSHV